VHTPNLPGIEDVSEFLKVKPKNMLKTLVFSVAPRATGETARPENLAHPKWLVAVVRGDHDVNEAKLRHAAKQHFNIESIALTDSPDVRASWAIGFVGPDAAIRNPEAVMLVDPDAAQGASFWVTGGNEIDYHVKHFNWFRECGDRLADPKKVAIADLRNAVEGDPSPRNDGGKLKLSRGIEIGHVFKLGTKYSDSMDAHFLDEKGERRPFIMGCYGIGIGRILIAAAETLYDDKGLIWPPSIAPFQVVVTPIKYEGDVKSTADRLYDELNRAGIDSILDDRDARPGFKFADADLIGFPVRINVGDRGLKEGKVELKSRKAKDAEMVPVDQAAERVKAVLQAW
jgi:prolyl-tRNA synthetase